MRMSSVSIDLSPLIICRKGPNVDLAFDCQGIDVQMNGLKFKYIDPYFLIKISPRVLASMFREKEEKLTFAKAVEIATEVEEAAKTQVYSKPDDPYEEAPAKQPSPPPPEVTTTTDQAIS